MDRYIYVREGLTFDLFSFGDFTGLVRFGMSRGYDCTYDELLEFTCIFE